VGQPHKLAKWLVAAILVAVVATTLALSLSASGDEQVNPSAGATQAAPADPANPVPSASPPLGGPRP
jgi:hypothetical protein